MTKIKNIKTSIRVDLFSLLFILFLTLKLMGKITWSWWWVTLPLWAPILLVLTTYVILKLKKKK